MREAFVLQIFYWFDLPLGQCSIVVSSSWKIFKYLRRNSMYIRTNKNPSWPEVENIWSCTDTQASTTSFVGSRLYNCQLSKFSIKTYIYMLVLVPANERALLWASYSSILPFACLPRVDIIWLRPPCCKLLPNNQGRDRRPSNKSFMHWTAKS